MFVYPYAAFPPDLFLDTLPSYLAKNGYEIDVVSHARNLHEKQQFARLNQKGMHFHLAEAVSFSIPGWVADFPFFLSLETLLNRLEPNIVHVNNLPFLTTLQSIRLSKKLGKIGIVHVHGVIGERGPILDFAQRAYIYGIGHTVFKNAAKVICLTVHDATKICGYGCPPEKVRIIPNGVDVDKFKPNGDEVNGLVMWSGRFVQQKGLTYLIKGLAIAAKRHPNIKLAMTGTGPLLPKIQTMVKEYKLMENVVLLGLRSRKELPSILNKASIFVLPSLNEGMPYVLLEAMACGKPVIGSDIPGINNVVTHGRNGLLVPSRNPVALADAITTLVEDENLRKELGRNARQLMLEKYNWEAITKEVEEVYREAITEA
jgi:glycosyltransferase involved in cell wall biosynthesis